MELEEMIDQQRWLINNGLFTDAIKNNIYLYGALVHRDVVSIDVSIDTDNKNIAYKLYVKDRLIDAISQFNRLKTEDSLWSLIKLKMLIKKFGNLNLLGILKNFIKDYCGPSWNVTMDIKSESDYDNGDTRKK